MATHCLRRFDLLDILCAPDKGVEASQMGALMGNLASDQAWFFGPLEGRLYRDPDSNAGVFNPSEARATLVVSDLV